MILIPVKQGSSEWLLHRFGVPTASNAGKIITAVDAKVSKAQDSYISELIAERHAKKTVLEDIKRLGLSENDIDTTAVVESIEKILNRMAKTDAMVYGNLTEPKAANAYEYLKDVELEEVGFMLNDERTAGASLDRLVKGQKRGVEFKTPFKLDVHIGYCLSRKIDIDKRPQLQWQLWISGLEGMDICAYYPGAVPVVVPVARDEGYIAKIAEYHKDFYSRLEQRWQEWENMQPEEKESAKSDSSLSQYLK